MEGRALGLVGESGYGKSTLGRCLVRLITPSGGKISIDGKDITHLKERQLRNMRQRSQIIFQNPDSSLNLRKAVENHRPSASPFRTRPGQGTGPSC